MSGPDPQWQLASLTWPEVEDRAPRTVLAIPIGSTEQHGPHLPLSTDTDIAVALCCALVERSEGEVMVAPPVAYGSSGEHDGFAGTLSIGQEALTLLTVELVRSASATFDAVVLVSGHGGNAVPLRDAVTRLTGEGRSVLLFEPSIDGDAHAGETETSLQLFLNAGQVRTDRLAVGDTRPLATIIDELRSGGLRSVTTNGVLGDPTAASAAAGADLFAAVVADLVTTVASWRATL